VDIDLVKDKDKVFDSWEEELSGKIKPRQTIPTNPTMVELQPQKCQWCGEVIEDPSKHCKPQAPQLLGQVPPNEKWYNKIKERTGY
jgi:hypothetical protein